MHIITKKVKGHGYLYLAWNEKVEATWKKRSKYLGKTPRQAIKTLGGMEIPDDERESLIETLDSDVWETPPFFLGLVRAVMGGIDLDPATKPSNPTQATKIFTKQDDGLSQEWAGRVFLNPPYSKPAPFLLKLISHYQGGGITEAIALCKQGVLSNRATCRAISESKSAKCLWEGRLNFTHSKAKDQGRGANFDVVAIYWGHNPDRFKTVFSPYGAVE